MSLDITFKTSKPVVCQRCGQLVKMEDVECEYSGGRAWYPVLEHFGYYVPYEERNEENDWYGKDMELDHEQTEWLREYIIKHKDLYCRMSVLMLVESCIYRGYTLTINADW